MAQSILIFDFGTNEEAAQQARHKVDAWQQGFRLGKKILLKFDREESNGGAGGRSAEPEEGTAAKGDAAKKSSDGSDVKDTGKNENVTPPSRVRVLIRLDFSDHEKLTQQRWLDRIPAEAPFKSAKGETIRHSDASFAATSKLFDSLD